MKAFFDTSALVPVFLEAHPHHEASLKAFVSSNRKQGCCAAHSLAEVYSTLTRMPPPHRVSGDHALLFLENIRERLTLIALDGDDYFTAIQSLASLGVAGGALYDGLLAHCARSRLKPI